MEEDPPLILCMENASGEDVALKILPEDDFQSFLDKAKSRLGFDVDLNTITKNEAVSLTDNIYKFLMNAENKTQLESTELNLDILEESASSDFVYMLDDGTQIDASQIQFENDEPVIEFRVNDLPFTKRKDVIYDEEEDETDRELIVYKIQGSVSRKIKSSNPKTNFASTLPFKILTLKAKQFEAQTTRYFNISKAVNKNVIVNESNKKVENDLRDQVLNIVKDSAVASFNDAKEVDGRRNVRKSDPSRPVIKKNDSTNSIAEINKNGSQYCFICKKFVERTEKLYIFDKDDQKLHRSLPQSKQSDKLKVICENCLESNFELGVIDTPEKTLADNEYLVIRNNQQYIFHRILKNQEVTKDPEKEKEIHNSEVKTEYIAPPNADKEVEVKGEEPETAEVADVIDDSTIENLEGIDDGVKEFLGEYQTSNSNEMICRFCKKEFTDVSNVIEHGVEHKHETDKENIYPCPLCDYGYVNYTWLKGHLKIAHGKKTNEESDKKVDNDEQVDSSLNKEEELDKPISSPIATRTRSSRSKKKNDSETIVPNKEEEETKKDEDKIAKVDEIKVEVKEEPLDDDDGIWILEAQDDQMQDEEKLDEELLDVKVPKNLQKAKINLKDMYRCNTCKHFFISKETLKVHKCVKKIIRKRKLNHHKDDDLYEPNFDDLSKKQRRKRSRDNPCDPQIVTCNHCNESFTSKVRLKFHMQFHETNCSNLTKDNNYKCSDCVSSNFATETELFDHVHFQHPKLKRWHCPVKECGKTFYLRATLTKHSRSHTDTRRYICPSCGKRFLDKQTLDEHGVTHLKIKPFECHICMKQLTRRSRLRMHLRAHEEALSPALVFVCCFCQRAFKDHIEAQEHTTSSEECIQKCNPNLDLSPTTGLIYEKADVKDICTKTTAKSRGVNYEPKDQAKVNEMIGLIKDTTMIIVVEIEKAFRCEYCEDVFYLEDALNKHRSIHKGVKEPFVCHICKVRFPTYSRCTTHKTTHGFYKRPLADVMNTVDEDNMKQQEDGLKRHENIPASGILGYGGFPVVKHFLCEDCGRSYLHWTYLQVHRRTKHPGKSMTYECQQCHLTFPNSWSVSYHKKKFHGKSLTKHGVKKTKDFWIPCRDCEEILPNKHSLYLHRSKEHCDISNEKDDTDPNISEKSRTSDKSRHRYFCLVCGHSFRTLTLRTEHLRIHTGEKPFVCQDCGVSFRRLSTFRNHRVTHLPLDNTPKIVTILIEVPGLNPTGEQIKEHLVKNNITVAKIVDVYKISYKQGEERNVPKNEEDFKTIMKTKDEDISTWKQQILNYFNTKNTEENKDDKTQPDRGFTQMHRPNILQRSGPSAYPITLNITGEELSDINVQLLLPEGVLLNGSQMVQLNPHHQILPESEEGNLNNSNNNNNNDI